MGATDITDIPMRRGFIDLVAVVDWTSRRVLAWQREYNEERPKKSLGGLTPAAYATSLTQKSGKLTPDSKVTYYSLPGGRRRHRE